MPSSSGAIRAGRAFVDLFADDKPLAGISQMNLARDRRGALFFRYLLYPWFCKRLDEQFHFECWPQRVIYPHEWADKKDPLRWITEEYTAALEQAVRDCPAPRPALPSPSLGPFTGLSPRRSRGIAPAFRPGRRPAFSPLVARFSGLTMIPA